MTLVVKRLRLGLLGLVAAVVAVPLACVDESDEPVVETAPDKGPWPFGAGGSSATAGAAGSASGGASGKGGAGASGAGAGGKGGAAGKGGAGASGASGQAGQGGLSGMAGAGGKGAAAGASGAGAGGAAGASGSAGAGGAGAGGASGNGGAGAGGAAGAGGTGGAGAGGTSGAGGAGNGGAGSGGAGSGGAGAGGGAGGAAGAPTIGPLGPCNAFITEQPLASATHVPVCTPIPYATNPPSSGPHYPIPAFQKTYDVPVPRGFWVHNMEHGAVVFSHHCPSGCADQVAAAQAVIDAYPTDPACTDTDAGAPRRILMLPDPELDVPFAASAWGWTLRADCFDPVVFGDFLKEHYGKAPESTCWNGDDIPNAGYPPDCGKL